MEKSKLLLLILIVLAVGTFNWGNNPAFAGPGGGTYYANSPAGGTSGTALRKFVDSLPGLGAANQNNLGQYIPVANPDTTTFAGSDYYVIGLQDYTEKLHSDLPKATKLRGYYQINSGTSGVTDHANKYLGPLILATKDRPVRIRFENHLGLGAAGNLFLPVDTTMMGAGLGPNGGSELYTQNRATLHLHGGNTPWISDGTPHQWITPAGDPTSYKKGVSFQNVPDMVGAGKPIPSPSAGDGLATFYYTNQQSNRLMFYHDHAYGITRLNVYAGEAAGYLLTDSAEEGLINAGILPNAGGVYRYGIPLIIQDKTFVPNDVAIQDAKWNTTNWGQPGDLWFPHVYEANQDPNSEDGTNPFGRWDYGPWFWPPVIVAADKATLPDPSTTPEAFMDTPLVNGAAYPFLPVEPKAYRFRILNASNDRMLNLQLYYVDPANPTEVKMVPALPNTGLPPTWPTDGRDGGVPDPTLVGPPFIQIGTEGGFLPNPVVIDSTPVGYEYNRRNIVVLNVANKSLFIGPAERADVIIDFSSVPSGSKLILYNDSPAPVPAGDPRLDYYTGNPDQTASGGAPTTLPTFGPNTRTIMQFQVSGTPTAPFNLAALQNPTTGLPAAYVASQDAPIVPEVDYPATYNAATNTYSKIQDYSLTFTPVGSIPGTGTPGTPVSRTVTIPMKSKAIQELWDPYGRMNATLGVELPFTNNNIQTTIPLGYVDPITEIIPDGQTQIWKITHNGVDTHPVHFHLYNVQVLNRVGWDGQIRPPDPNELGWKETVRMHPLEDCIVALKAKKQTGLPFAVVNSLRSPDTTTSAADTITVITPVELPGTNAGNPVTISNAAINFGWEYVWHCHILGHEENDFMRPMVLSVPTAVPVAAANMNAAVVAPVLPATVGNSIRVSWVAGAPTVGNPDPEINFRIIRDGTAITTYYSGMPEGVGRIDVTNGGTVYATPPAITFVGGGGTGATAHATVAGNAVTAIIIDTPGTGYSSPPTVVFNGVPFNGTTNNATATANLLHTFTDIQVAKGTTYTYGVMSYNSLGDAATAPTAAATTGSWTNASGVTLTPNLASPHTEGTGVIFTATGTGSTAAYLYQFLMNGTIVQDYGVGSFWTLPASTAVGNYLIAVNVKTNGTPLAPVEAATSVNYQVVAGTNITGVTITPTVLNPLKTRPVLFTASGPGTSGYQYRFLMNGTIVQDYGVGSSWLMPATTPPGTYLIEVDARVGTSGTVTASASLQYTVTGPVYLDHDFNNDGLADVLWRHAGSGQVEIWNMNGTTIASQGSPATIGDLNWEIKGVGGFNGDGFGDVLWRNKVSGQVMIWLMNGNTIASQGSPATIGDLNWEIKGVGDFDGDGKTDILWQNKVSGQVIIWLMNGATLASQGSPATIGDLNWEIKGVGDFNRDGKADILWKNKVSGQVYVWLMNGTAIASQSSPATIGDSDQNWEVKGVGDFNGDGFDDILWKNKATGQVFIWLMNSTAIASQGSPGSVSDLNWEIRGVGDYNGDGKVDILWRNKATGQVYIWLMNGTTATSQGSPATISDLNWDIK